MSALVLEVREALSLPPPSVAQAIRASAHVSQERLAGELGVHRVTVARWEAGQRVPRGALRAQYAGLLRQLTELIAS